MKIKVRHFPTNTPRGFHVETDRFHVASMWNPRGVFVGFLLKGITKC